MNEFVNGLANFSSGTGGGVGESTGRIDVGLER